MFLSARMNTSKVFHCIKCHLYSESIKILFTEQITIQIEQSYMEISEFIHDLRKNKLNVLQYMYTLKYNEDHHKEELINKFGCNMLQKQPDVTNQVLLGWSNPYLANVIGIYPLPLHYFYH